MRQGEPGLSRAGALEQSWVSTTWCAETQQKTDWLMEAHPGMRPRYQATERSRPLGDGRRS